MLKFETIAKTFFENYKNSKLFAKKRKHLKITKIIIKIFIFIFNVFLIQILKSQRLTQHSKNILAQKISKIPPMTDDVSFKH